MSLNKEPDTNGVLFASISERRQSISTCFEILAFYGILLTILAASVPYGTITDWLRLLVVVLICIFAGFRVIENAVRGPFRVSEPGLLSPLFGVLCLAFAQIITWRATSSPLTFDPYETKAFILVFAGLLVAGEVLFRYAGDPSRLRHLVGLVLVVGSVSALFGLLRPVFFDSIFVSLAEYTQATQGYAQFINRNHFAVLMEMTLGLLLGFLIKGGLSERLKLLVWILAGIIIVALITANSRGGLISLVALSVFAAFVHLMTRVWSKDSVGGDQAAVRRNMFVFARRAIAGIGICGFVLATVVIMIVFVGGDGVVTRIEKLKDEVEAADGGRVNRVVIWTSTFELIKRNPVFGIGFGGYPVAITGFDPSAGKAPLQQAHNEYLEIAANGGIVGLALFAAFGVMVVLRILRNLRSCDRFTRSSSFGAAVGIFGVLIHSFVDFGLHTMINGLIFVALIVISTVDTSTRGPRRRLVMPG